MENPISVVIKLYISHYGINTDVGEQQNFIGYHGTYYSFYLYMSKVHIRLLNILVVCNNM